MVKSLRVVVLALICFGVALLQPWTLLAQSKSATIQESDLRQFLNYISSDQLLGRQTFTEGYGLAAGYVAAHLEQWGVKPLGDNGTYLQTVKLNDVKVVSDNSTVTVDVNGFTFRNEIMIGKPIFKKSYERLHHPGNRAGYGVDNK